MEHVFRRHNYAFFLEFKHFSFHFAKTITSFLKLSFETSRLLVFLLKSLIHLLFVGPSLVKWHSPNHKTSVERNIHATYPPKFY
jgi:hypothetical protein